MLRVTVEIVPFGNEEEAYVIERMLLANVYTSTNDTADYEYIRTDRGKNYAGTYNKFPRKNGAWQLIWTVLDDAEEQGYFDEDIDKLSSTQAALADRLIEYRNKNV